MSTVLGAIAGILAAAGYGVDVPPAIHNGSAVALVDSSSSLRTPARIATASVPRPSAADFYEPCTSPADRHWRRNFSGRTRSVNRLHVSKRTKAKHKRA